MWGSWQADGVQLARASDGTYSGSLALEAGQTLEYKFTCGSWDAVEKAADGSDRGNRVEHVNAAATPITATVERWAAEPVRGEHGRWHAANRAGARCGSAPGAHDPRLAAAGV